MTDTEALRTVIAAWAVRYGALPDIAESFAYWYTTDDRSDSYADAYDVFRVLCGSRPVADVEAVALQHEFDARAIRSMGSRELAAFYGWER